MSTSNADGLSRDEFTIDQFRIIDRALHGDLVGKINVTPKDMELYNKYSAIYPKETYANEYRRAYEYSYIPRAKLKQMQEEGERAAGLLPPKNNQPQQQSSGYMDTNPLYTQQQGYYNNQQGYYNQQQGYINSNPYQPQQGYYNNPTLNGYQSFSNPYQNYSCYTYGQQPNYGYNINGEFVTYGQINPFSYGYYQQQDEKPYCDDPVINFAVSKIMQISDLNLQGYFDDCYYNQPNNVQPEYTNNIDFLKDINTVPFSESREDKSTSRLDINKYITKDCNIPSIDISKYYSGNKSFSQAGDLYNITLEQNANFNYSEIGTDNTCVSNSLQANLCQSRDAPVSRYCNIETGKNNNSNQSGMYSYYDPASDQYNGSMYRSYPGMYYTDNYMGNNSYDYKYSKAFNSPPPYANTAEYKKYMKNLNDEKVKTDTAIFKCICKLTNTDYDEYVNSINEKMNEKANEMYDNRHKYDNMSSKQAEYQRKVDNNMKLALDASMRSTPVLSNIDLEKMAYNMYFNSREYKQTKKDLPNDMSTAEFLTYGYSKYKQRTDRENLLRKERKDSMLYDSNNYHTALINSGTIDPYFLKKKSSYDPNIGYYQLASPVESISDKYNERRGKYIEAANRRGGDVL